MHASASSLPPLHTHQAELYWCVILATDPLRARPLAEKLRAVDYKWGVRRLEKKESLPAETAAIAKALMHYTLRTGQPMGLVQLQACFPEPKKDSPLEWTLQDIARKATSNFLADEILAQVDRQIRLQQSEAVLLEWAEAIETRDLEKADEIVSDIKNSVPASSLQCRIEMTDSAQAFSFLDEEEDECSRLLIPIDAFMERNITLRKGRVTTFLARYYGGKSTFIRDCIFMNLARNRCILYSLESGDRPNAGFLMRAFSLTRDPFNRLDHSIQTPVKIPRIVKNEKVITVSHVIRHFDCIQHKRREIAESGQLSVFGNLTIVVMPPNTLTSQMIRADLQRGIAEGRPYGIVAVDYTDKMKMRIREAADKRLETIRVTEEFSQICHEFNVAGVTGQQLSKEGIRSNSPDGSMSNESIDKPMLADDLFVYYQDETMKKAGIARVTIDKVRGRKGGATALVAQAYDIGSFCVDSVIEEDAATYYQGMEEQITQMANQRQQRVITLIKQSTLPFAEIATQLHESVEYVRNLSLNRRYVTQEEHERHLTHSSGTVQ